jgi:uncharacterized Zn finger protein (UPF0148 family)
MKLEMKSKCDNCDWVGEPEDKEIPGLHERVDPGGTMPSGECPECGCLCYPDVDTRYLLTPTDKVWCPKCERKVSMLATQELDGPAFYICFSCRHVAQIGVGPVNTVTE